MNRKVAITVSIVALAYLLLWAGAWGVANFASLGPRRIMALLERDIGNYDRVAWESAHNTLLKASNLNPVNADYIYDMGRLSEWRAIGLPVWTREARQYRSKAIEYFQLGLTMRPSSSLMWAQLANSNVLNQDINKETFDALEKAIVFGPWAEVAGLKVIWVGIVIWDMLPAQSKKQLNKVVARALSNKNQARYVIATAVWLGWEKNLRPLITKESNKKTLKRVLKKFGKR